MWFLGHWRWRAGWQEHIHSEAQTLMKQSNFLLHQPSSEQVILFLTSPSPKLQSSAQGFLCSSWISKWEGSVLCKLREANRLHTQHNAGWGAPFADYRWSRDDGKRGHNLPALQKMGFGKSLCLMFPITLIWGQSVTGRVAVRCVCVCPRVGTEGRWGWGGVQTKHLLWDTWSPGLLYSPFCCFGIHHDEKLQGRAYLAYTSRLQFTMGGKSRQGLQARTKEKQSLLAPSQDQA